MPTYTATFFTAADCASRPIEAANAQQALELARKAYDEHFSELEFRSHDGIEPLEQIEICNDENFADGAYWESEGRCLRQAARDCSMRSKTRRKRRKPSSTIGPKVISPRQYAGSMPRSIPPAQRSPRQREVANDARLHNYPQRYCPRYDHAWRLHQGHGPHGIGRRRFRSDGSALHRALSLAHGPCVINDDNGAWLQPAFTQSTGCSSPDVSA